MWFTHLFVPQAVGIQLQSREIKGAIGELIAALKETGRIQDDALARRDVYAREEEGSTWIGQAVAVPHAATEAVDQPLIAHGYSDAGVRIGPKKQEKHHARHVFLILGAPSSRPLHLRILARLSRLLSTSEFRRDLDGCTNGQEVLALLQSYGTSNQQSVDIAEMPRVTVFASDAHSIGLAAHASLLGCRVKVLGRPGESLSILASMRGITVEGRLKGFAQFEWVGTEPDAGLSEADLLLISSPVREYASRAESLIPHLREGQSIILIPGRLGGGLAFSNAVRRGMPGKVVYVCEAQHSLYEAAMESPAKVDIRRINGRVPVSAIPAYGLPDVLGVLNSALPYFVPGGNILETGFRNFATFFVPALALLNSTRFPGPGEPPPRLRDFLDQPVVRVLESVDAERVGVAEALGLAVSPAVDDLEELYGAYGDTLLRALLSTREFEEPLVVSGMDDPGLSDGIEFGLAPLVSLADAAGVSVPTAESLLRLARVMMEADEAKDPEKPADSFVGSVTADEIRALLRDGQWPDDVPGPA
jgi:mannitol/fructose-specific phosphotransferase system IIA component (Ntr-type)